MGAAVLLIKYGKPVGSAYKTEEVGSGLRVLLLYSNQSDEGLKLRVLFF
jgi:hypothetical protein